MIKLTKLHLTLFLALLLPVLTSCEKPKSVEVNFSQEDLDKAREQKRTRRSDSTTPGRRPVPVRNDKISTEVVSQTPAVKTPAPEIQPFMPIVVEGAKMTSDNSANNNVDSKGGRIMVTSGEIKMEHVKFPYTPRSVTVEAKATSANGIWPKYKLYLLNEEKKTMISPWGEDGVCSGTEYTRDYRYTWHIPENPFTPGTYTVGFYYLNNNEGIAPNSTEDRNLYLRYIEFHP